MPLYAHFSGDREDYRFEADDDGIIWDPPVPVSTMLMGHPSWGIGHLRLRRKRTVLLSDVQLAFYRTSYSRVVQIDASGKPLPDPRPTLLLGVDLVPLKDAARTAIRRACMWSDGGHDERAIVELGERGWPVHDREWDTARKALETRRTPKQRERFQRVLSTLKDEGPGKAQALLDRLLDLNEDDRSVLQRSIRRWPHRLATAKLSSGRFSRRRPQRLPRGGASGSATAKPGDEEG